MKKTKLNIKLGVFAFVYSFMCLQAAHADDTEVFFGATSEENTVKPNILFVFDTSGSMSSSQSYVNEDGQTVKQSRIGILQDVMSDLMATQTGINMGLSRFSVPGGPILYPVTNPDEKADPIVLKSITSADDDATQVVNSVTLDAQYLNPGGAGDVIGLRYQDVRVPQGARITAANLVFSTDIDSFDPASYEIYAEIVPNAPAFTTGVKDLSRRISGTPVAWVVEPWDAEPIVDVENDPPTSFESADIASVLQQVVDQKGATISDPAGWCGGNDLVILLKKITDTGRPIISHNKSQDFSPKLRVDFDANLPASANGCFTNTVVAQIAGASKDSEKSGSTIRDNSGDLDFSYDDYYKETNDSIALAFENILIPQGSEISKAELQFISANTNSGAAKATIYAVNSANPPLDNLVHNSNNLSAGVAWDIPSWDFGVPYSSADISSIVEGVIGLASWSSGSNMAFLLKGDSGRRAAYSYNGSASRAPSLEITYRGAFTPNEATKRSLMINTIEDFKATGNTPISDTIAEAGLYFKGEAVEYGLVRGSPEKRDNRISHIDTVVSGSGLVSTPAGCTSSNPSATACKDEKLIGTPVYDTPIKDGCQPNHIVLLTDGAPTSHDTRTNDLYERWTKENSVDGTAGSCNTNDKGIDCTIKMAGFFHDNDLLPDMEGIQKISTHTIGFYSDQDFLRRVAEAGHGKYVTAFSKQELIDAINDIVGTILDVNTTFVSAGVTVNQYNRLTHNDELYFSLFTPSSETVWPGNLKRYRLLDGELVDVKDDPAVNISGEFDEKSQSYWSSQVDGSEVERGGAAEFLTADRRVFSNLTSDINVDLTMPGNKVHETNTAITEAMVSAVDPDDRKTILNWAIGQDVNNAKDPTAARQSMGDPLHSQPSVLIYKTGTDTFRTSVYVGSNDGFVHSFDNAAGKENWAFIPKELLSRLSEVQKNTEGAHTYGMDGSVALYIQETPGTGTPGVVDSGERAFLYIGMRRGGSAYYALEVTDPDNPKLLFKIDNTTLGVSGGQGLGQTWSQPSVKKYNDPAHPTVLIFGGGYSDIQDTEDTASQTDAEGRNIFIVDALTGELVWDVRDAVDASALAGSNAGSLDTMNAIPDQITAFDIDGDQYIDHFYAADTKAQIFRFDIDYDTGLITGGRIAHLQSAADAANNRRFYNTPDVSLVRLTTGSFVSIAIGSGYRAHPLNETVSDHFYMVKDKGILKGLWDMDAALSDLADVTSTVGDVDANGVSDAAELINDPLNPKDGWYITFSNTGEKVITSSLTFNNAVIFTSYTPPSEEGDVCTAVAGTSRIYGMRITDGNPYLDTNNDSLLTERDRADKLTVSGIAPPPQVLLEQTDTGVKARLCVGNVCGLDEFLPPPPEGVMGIRWRKN